MTLYQHKYRIESTRLSGWDYRSRGSYFVTICTHEKTSIFGRVVNGRVHLSRAGAIAESGLTTLHEHYDNVEVDEHVVVPNHVHAIIRIDGEHCFSPTAQSIFDPHMPGFVSPKAVSLAAIVRSYKAGVTRQCHELGFTQTLWQSRYHDHLLRGDKVVAAVREYIRNNPSNWLKDRENHP